MLQEVRSHRQEAIDSQLSDIEKVLNHSENIFEPGKKIEFDKSFSGDQFKYQYQLEEKELQRQLFEAYDQLVEENDE